jgi:hypothetical protein
MSDPTRLYAGQGILYAADLDPDLGNCTSLEHGSSVERRQKREMRTGKQNLLISLVRQVTVSVTFMLDSTAKENLARFYYGTATDLAAASISNEALLGYKGKSAKLSRINLATWTSLTNAGGTVTLSRDTGASPGPTAVIFNATTDVFEKVAHGLAAGTRLRLAGSPPSPFVVGTDYYVITPNADDFQLSATRGGSAIVAAAAGSGITYTPQYDYSVNLKSGMVSIYPGAAITDGDSLRANFAAGESEKIVTFNQTNKAISLLFEGLNTAEDDDPVIVEAFRFRPNPPSTWALIQEDGFTEFEIQGDLEYAEAFESEGGLFRVTKLQPA